MKTPIQELIDKWEQEKGSYIPNAPIFQEFINDAKEMLKKEKEVMCEFAEEFAIECMDHYSDRIMPQESQEQFFNETFNK